MTNRVRGAAIVILVLTAILLSACSGPTAPTVYGPYGAGAYCSTCGKTTKDTTSTTTPVPPTNSLDTLAINTASAPNWDGKHTIGILGDAGQLTVMGQSFTTTAKDTLLNNFSFFVLPLATPSTIRFYAYVAKWDGSKVVGNILWQSQVQTGPTSASQKYTFQTSNLKLDPNAQYIVFLSTIEALGTFPSNQGVNMGYCGSNADPLHPVSSGPYTGGRFFYIANATSMTAINTAWSVDGGGDFDAAVVINLSNQAR